MSPVSDLSAVIRDVGYGRRGSNKPGLYFESWLPNGNATLHLLYGKEADAVLAAAGATTTDVSRLEGHSCRVRQDGHVLRFLGLSPLNPLSA